MFKSTNSFPKEIRSLIRIRSLKRGMAKQERWGHGRLLKTKKVTVSLAVDDIAFHTKNGKSIQFKIRIALNHMRILKEKDTDIYELLECQRKRSD